MTRVQRITRINELIIATTSYSTTNYADKRIKKYLGITSEVWLYEDVFNCQTIYMTKYNINFRTYALTDENIYDYF